jgi:ABC-type multidrug transport system ATPase subunit
VIRLDDVTVAVRGRTILEGCNATIPPATITHLTGVNGSGKTTLIRAIAGIQRYSGSILFDGMDAARVRPQVYVCFDDAAVFPFLTGYENIRMLLGRTLSRTAIAMAAPALAGPTLLRQHARKLSHGQRKRLHLVAALLSGARYLLLDEALDGVDAPTATEVRQALRRHAADATVLLTGHGAGLSGDAYSGLATHRLVLSDRSISSGFAQ